MKGELHFEIRKAGTLHGFTAWFSVQFQDKPQLVLSTGPFHPGDACPVSCTTTLQKQVLFMMDEPVSVFSGVVVTGSVVLQRNPVWRRHMSVALSWSITSTQDPTSQKVRLRRSFPSGDDGRSCGSRCCRNEPGRRRAWV
ncbi:unnamed protein product [Nyctereutes procyonoides]|uniref:(raccoon dog) hypothetical protein n=1 Tax=Nyctereutes procyonoides TaxID=34880 RepID=A0A811YSS6_NYCPR|nr:unnamed protein product [Nyctereutes procyonoides]CAD7688183.1 unnamed protein product [Nyctereutes procyonoides]